ncbi:uncharacterized protein Dmoj_GI26227 [Drosophila mojavensis]|uniref:Uncharacterized protein n=1 Tax=Drosophila mojavensis TaxID=7230 RepID=A0A0Q9XSV6_DROMO|nr:uncharacterized protein Dmoj_GI26227 [Drosophila mojavensis]
MFCRRCWIDFTAGEEDYVVCAGPCAWPYHATCAAVPRELARELRRSSSNNFDTNFPSFVPAPARNGTVTIVVNFIACNCSLRYL